MNKLSTDEELYLVDTIFAFLVCNRNGEVVFHVILPLDVDILTERLLKLERTELIEEIKILCNKINELNIKRIIVEDESIAVLLKNILMSQIDVKPGNPIARKIRESIIDIAIKLGLFQSDNAFKDFVHEVALSLSRKKLREAAEKRDLMAAQSINAIDDLNKSINLMVTRLREWYSVHFPELDALVSDHRVYASLVNKLGLRDNYTVEKLSSFNFNSLQIEKIVSAANASIGAEIAEFDIKSLKHFANIMNQMYNLREELEKYIDKTMDEVAPNIKALVGPLIGARLISLAGGLNQLAKLPASTIQVLGAEKALFRALRTGSRPPKHGIIFQCPEIHSAPKWQRGKIARALAGKLTIAARIDAFSGTYFADELKEDLNKRIEEIKRIYSVPPQRRIPVKKIKRRKKRSKKRSKRR